MHTEHSNPLLHDQENGNLVPESLNAQNHQKMGFGMEPEQGFCSAKALPQTIIQQSSATTVRPVENAKLGLATTASTQQSCRTDPEANEGKSSRNETLPGGRVQVARTSPRASIPSSAAVSIFLLRTASARGWRKAGRSISSSNPSRRALKQQPPHTFIGVGALDLFTLCTCISRTLGLWASPK